MKRIFLIVIIALMALLLATFTYVYSTDGVYDYSGTTTLNAPAERLYKVIANLHAFSRWEPWKLGDPTATYEVSGSDATVGQTYTWEGEELGWGRLTNARLIPYSRIDQKLAFQRGDRDIKAAN